MVRSSVRWPGRRKAWTAISGAIAFVLVSGMVLGHPGPPPPPTLVEASRYAMTTNTPSSTTTNLAQSVNITTTPSDPTKGITVYATPLSDGRLSMTETVRFIHPQDQITLSPPKVKDAGAAFAGLIPKVSQIELTADQRDLEIEPRTLTKPLVVALKPAAMRVDVRYLLANVMSIAEPGKPSSALVAPLIDGLADGLEVSYVIGSQIGSFACPQLPTSTAKEACQAQGGAHPDVGLISGLPSTISLLVVGLPSGTTPNNPPSGSTPPSQSPETSSSSSDPPAQTTTPPPAPPSSSSTTPPDVPPSTTSDPTGTSSESPTDTATTEPAPPETPTPDPTPTVTASPSPTTDASTDGTPAESTTPSGDGAATDPASTSGKSAGGVGPSGAPATVPDPSTTPDATPTA